MDLLDEKNALNLSDPTWRIYTEDVNTLPQYISPDAEVDRAYISEGCIVRGKVQNSVLFTNSTVEDGAQVIDTVLMPGSTVKSGAVVTRAIVGESVTVGANVTVGSKNSENIELVAKNVKGDE